MYKCRMKAYEGSENYIFISYAHKDSEKVLPILDLLNDHGYRVWYDDGIAPGSEWPEYIADHLNRSAITIAFISPNSIASPNCRREVTFALSKNKNFLAIQLEPTQMSLGMEMQLSAHQVVFRYNFATDEAFMEKLNSMKELSTCLRPAPVSEPVPVTPAPMPQTAPTVSAAASPSAISGEDMAAVDRMMAYTQTPTQPVQPAIQPAPAPIPAPMPQPVVVPMAPAKPPMDKKKKMILGISVGAASLICVIVGIVLLVTKPWKVKIQNNSGSTTTNVDLPDDFDADNIDMDALPEGLICLPVAEIPEQNLEVSKSDSSLTLRDFYLTEDVISALNSMKDLEYLYLKNCVFVTDLSSLNNLSAIKALEAENCAGLLNFGCFSQMSSANTIKLINCGVNDTLDLSGIAAATIDLSGNPNFTAVSQLPLDSLYNLYLNGTSVSDISPLASCPHLERLELADTLVTDVSPAAQLTTLTKVSFENCALEPVTEVFHSLSIFSLNVSGCGLDDLSAFENLTILKYFYGSSNTFTDAACVAKSIATLETIEVDNTPVSAEFLTSISQCTNLKELCISGNEAITSLDFIDGLSNLQLLHAENCSIAGTDGLFDKPYLQEVDLSGNKITFISDFANIGSALTSSLMFDLSYNQISDLSNLPTTNRLNTVSLHGNPLDYTTLPDASAFSGGFYGALTLDYAEGMEEISLFKDQIFNFLYIIDIPADKQLAIKDAFAFHLRMTDAETLDSYLAESISYSNWSE